MQIVNSINNVNIMIKPKKNSDKSKCKRKYISIEMKEQLIKLYKSAKHIRNWLIYLSRSTVANFQKNKSQKPGEAAAHELIFKKIKSFQFKTQKAGDK